MKEKINMNLNKTFKIIIVIAISIIASSIFYYHVIFLPFIEEGIIENEYSPEQGTANQENIIIYAKIGESKKIGDYEVVVNGLVFEDGPTIHEERIKYFKEIGLSTYDWSANYYKNTYKIIIPYITIKNLNKTNILRFDPKDFSLVTISGYRYKHIQTSNYYDGGKLIGGEIAPGYINNGWYGFELPKGYNEGNKIFLEIIFPEVSDTLAVEINLPY